MVLPLPVILASAMLGAHKVGAAARKSSRAERPQEGEYKFTRTATSAADHGVEASAAPPVAKPVATADVELQPLAADDGDDDEWAEEEVDEQEEQRQKQEMQKGANLIAAGKYKKAAKLFEGALRRRNKAFSPDDVKVLTVKTNLVVLKLKYLDDAAGAVALARELVASAQANPFIDAAQAAKYDALLAEAESAAPKA